MSIADGFNLWVGRMLADFAVAAVFLVICLVVAVANMRRK